MRWFLDAVGLLRESERLYGNLRFRPPRLKPIFPQNLFQIGGRWMKKAFCQIGGENLSRRLPPFQELGYFKYGLASWAALVAFCLLFEAGPWACLAGVVVVFYLVESQMVFLFPLSIAGSVDPVRESLREVRRAGGALRVMAIVMVVACYMVTGGLFRENLKKSWCVGCLAVLVWHFQVTGKRISSYDLP